MTTFHENIRNVLSEIDKFLDSLKAEKLAKKVQTNKDKVIELIKKLREDWPALEVKDKLEVQGGNDRDVSNESVQTKTSHGSGAGDDDDTAYGDNVPEKSVKDLTSPIKKGYLDKKRKKASLIQSAFQRRYCVVQDRILYYFEKENSPKQAGAFYLEEYEFREAPQITKDSGKKDLCFELVAAGKRTYQFVAESKEDFQAWRSAITGSGSASGDIEGEFEDIYEDVDEVAEKARAIAETEPSSHAQQEDQEVYDDAETMPQPEPESDEIYDDVDNVDKAMEMEKSKDVPPPVPPPLSNKPSKPSLPSLPPPSLPPTAIQQQPLPELPPPQAEKSSPSRPELKITINPDEDYDNMYYGKWDCDGSSEDELSFKHGDVIHVINREFDNKDWWVGRLGENFGLVPKNYLIRAYKAL